jgi:hypothetical protein
MICGIRTLRAQSILSEAKALEPMCVCVGEVEWKNRNLNVKGQNNNFHTTFLHRWITFIFHQDAS